MNELLFSDGLGEDPLAASEAELEFVILLQDENSESEGDYTLRYRIFLDEYPDNMVEAEFTVSIRDPCDLTGSDRPDWCPPLEEDDGIPEWIKAL